MALYDHAWRRYSKRRLAQFPLCVRCLAKGKMRLAVVTDHTIPHRGDVGLFRDPDNHQSLCKRCHDRKTRLEDMPRLSGTPTAKPARRALSEPASGQDEADDEHTPSQ